MSSVPSGTARPQPAIPHRPGGRRLQGIALVVLAVACFAALDTTTKQVGTLVPVAMAVWFRYAFQAAVTAGLLLPGRGRRLLRTRHPWLQVLRGALLVTTSVLTFLCLRVMPVGEFTAVIMLTPLLMVVVAARASREPLSPLRWLLLLGGFSGALMALHPGHQAIGWALLLPAVQVLALASFQLLTSRLAQTEDAGTTHFYTGLIGMLITGATLPWVWAPLSGWLPWMLLLMTGLFASAGHLLLILGYERAPVSLLSPYLYLQVAFATLGGWLVFGHVPDALAVSGIVLICACGAAGTWLSGMRRHSAGDASRPVDS
jgi:drug/metabolite transporter (DMT)-like permease